MQDHYAEIRQLGGEVLVVSFASPALLALYERQQALPFPVVADPTLTAYHAFGLERTSWRAMMRVGVVWRVVRLMLRGWSLRRPHKEEDLLQMGGDFILDEHRRLVYAHRSVEPTDRPPATALLQAIAKAASTGKTAD